MGASLIALRVFFYFFLSSSILFLTRESGNPLQFREKNKQTGYPQECECYFGPIRNICVCGLRSQRVVCATLNMGQVPSLFSHIQYILYTHARTHTHIYLYLYSHNSPYSHAYTHSPQWTCHVSWRQGSDTGWCVWGLYRLGKGLKDSHRGRERANNNSLKYNSSERTLALTRGKLGPSE